MGDDENVQNVDPKEKDKGDLPPSSDAADVEAAPSNEGDADTPASQDNEA